MPPSIDRESQLIAQYMQHTSALIMAATTRVSSRSTIGEAAANRLRIDSEVAGLLRTAENICTLTRRIRELWIVGALREPGEGDVEAETRIRTDVLPLVAQMEALQTQQRQADLGPYGTHQTTPTGGPAPPPQQQQQPPANAAAPPPAAVAAAATTTAPGVLGDTTTRP